MRICLLALMMASTAAAQSALYTAPQHVDVPTLTPRPADIETMDGIVAAYYDVVSGPAGQQRQWGRDRTLYWPGIRFVVASVNKDGTPAVHVFTHQQLVEATNASLVRDGFEEREIHRVTQRIGNIAHVMSTYETRAVGTGPVTARGVNSLDLVWDGKRWWITASQWDEERPGSPIPRELLP